MIWVWFGFLCDEISGERKCNLRKCLLVMILTPIQNQKLSPLKGMKERRKSGIRSVP